MARYNLPAVIFAALSLLFGLNSAALAQTAPGPLVLEDYGSLNGAVDEKKFKPALEAWIEHGNALVAEFKALPPNQADRRLIDDNPLRNLQLAAPLERLEKIVRPVLSRWENHWDQAQLSADDRRVVAVLQKYGLKLEAVEGYPFLMVDQVFFENLIKPYLSPAAADYLALKGGQPQIFFADAGCYYSVEEMGDWAAAWENLLAGSPDSAYKETAGDWYRLFMNFILFSELDNTPAFPRYNEGKMEEHWLEGLKTVAARHPGSRTADMVTRFIAAIEADGCTLSPAVKKDFTAEIETVISPPVEE